MRALVLFLLIPAIGLGQLPSSGAISLGQIRDEQAKTGSYSISTAKVDYNQSGWDSFSDYYGATGVGIVIVGLEYNSSNSNCATHLAVTRYGSTNNLATTTKIWSNITKTTLAPTGWYSNGTIRRYWNATTQTLGNSELC